MYYYVWKTNTFCSCAPAGVKLGELCPKDMAVEGNVL